MQHGVQQLLLLFEVVELVLVVVVQHGSQHESPQLSQLLPNSTCAPTPRYGTQSSRSNVHDKWVKSEWDMPRVRAMLSELQLKN